MNTIEPLIRKGNDPIASAPSRWSRFRTFSGSVLAAASLLLAAPTGAPAATLDVGEFGIDTTSRTLPAVLNTAVDLGAFTFSGNTGSLVVSVNVGGNSWSVAKRYVIPMRFNLTGISPANTWLKVLPTHDTGAFQAKDCDLDINVAGGVMNVRLRVSATDGVKIGTANIVVESTGVSAIAFSTASAVVVPPTAAQTFGGAVLTQIGGRVGVNAVPSADAALDINGGNTKGLRIRPRTTLLAPTTGTWSKGTIIVDSNYDLYICTLDGTPGTWKKVGTP